MFRLTENMTNFQSSISHHTQKGKKLLDRENQNTKTTYLVTRVGQKFHPDHNKTRYLPSEQICWTIRKDKEFMPTQDIWYSTEWVYGRSTVQYSVHMPIERAVPSRDYWAICNEKLNARFLPSSK